MESPAMTYDSATKSVVTIQALMRGACVRLRAEKVILSTHVVRLQTAMRLHLVMARFKRMRLNAVRVQRAWRDHAFRANVLRVSLFEQHETEWESRMRS
eukprot:7377403-Prymnesium_polylepis.1